MNFKLYIIRAIKSILYIAIIFTILLTLMYVFSDRKDANIGFFDLMIPAKNRFPLIGFIIVFGFAYPFITFIKKNVYLNKPFTEERAGIMNIMEVAGYELTGEDATTLVFRPKNKVARMMRMMEDAVTIDFSDNPIVMNGIRKEVYRLAKHIEYQTLKNTQEG